MISCSNCHFSQAACTRPQQSYQWDWCGRHPSGRWCRVGSRPGSRAQT